MAVRAEKPKSSPEVLEARRLYYLRNREKVRARVRAYQQANRETVLAKQRERYATQREAISTQRREDYASSPEQYREATRRWREENRERHSAYSRRWRAENLERARAADKAKKLANPIRVREQNARRRARLRAAQVEPVDYAAIYERDGGICHICSLPVGASLHYDHVIPIARGGAHAPDNIKVAHATCNLRKATKVAA